MLEIKYKNPKYFKNNDKLKLKTNVFVNDISTGIYEDIVIDKDKTGIHKITPKEYAISGIGQVFKKYEKLKSKNKKLLTEEEKQLIKIIEKEIPKNKLEELIKNFVYTETAYDELRNYYNNIAKKYIKLNYDDIKINMKIFSKLKDGGIIQEYMDKYYDIWQKEFKQDKNWKNKENLKKDVQIQIVEYINDKDFGLKNDLDLITLSVALGNLNYQVTNGGFSQYMFNGYWNLGSKIIPDFINLIKENNEIREKLKNNFDEVTYRKFLLVLANLENIFKFINENKDEEEYKITCTECEGSGEIYYSEEDSEGYEECSVCEGEGEIYTRELWEFVEDNFSLKQFDENYFDIDNDKIIEIYNFIVEEIKNNSKLRNEWKKKFNAEFNLNQYQDMNLQ